MGKDISEVRCYVCGRSIRDVMLYCFGSKEVCLCSECFSKVAKWLLDKYKEEVMK